MVMPPFLMKSQAAGVKLRREPPPPSAAGPAQAAPAARRTPAPPSHTPALKALATVFLRSRRAG